MTEFIEVKTADLTGEALNWAVSRAMGVEAEVLRGGRYGEPDSRWFVARAVSGERLNWIEDWALTGPLLGMYKLTLSSPLSPVHRHGGPNVGWGPSGGWSACTWEAGFDGRRSLGFDQSSELTAICRCIVRHCLGLTVSIPVELVGP